MNPFNLPGPQFLLFYLCFAVAVIVAVGARRRMREPAGPSTAGVLQDPYRIAFLRGGKKELLNSVVSLLNRSLLHQKDDSVKSDVGWRRASVREAIERSVLEYCETKRTMAQVHAMPCEAEVNFYQEELRRLGLMPDADQESARRADLAIAAIALMMVATVKYELAVARGRSNRNFLIVLCIIAVVALIKFSLPRLTSKGEAALASRGIALRIARPFLHSPYGTIRAGDGAACRRVWCGTWCRYRKKRNCGEPLRVPDAAAPAVRHPRVLPRPLVEVVGAAVEAAAAGAGAKRCRSLQHIVSDWVAQGTGRRHSHQSLPYRHSGSDL